MCGICGVVPLDGRRRPEDALLCNMRDALDHRGPDSGGVWSSVGVGLGSARLAIVDLSSRGDMPMLSEDGRYAIVHNGEVYNFRELRSDLEKDGFRFRSDTDTEVLLRLYDIHGSRMLNVCRGMFAFAIWDEQEHALFAARDRFGVKPFCWALHDGALFFASEEKALFTAGVPRAFDAETWDELFFFRYVAGNRTPYAGVRRLLPGHYMEVRDGTVGVTEWWRVPEGEMEPVYKASSSELRELMDESIRLRRVSDAPLGILLSGGLDSSAIAAVAATQASEPVSTFTIRFGDEGVDEWRWAESVGHLLDLTMRSLTVSADELPGLLIDAIYHADHPLVHGSDTHLLALSRYAKRWVTVLLSGEGADELLGGYGRYLPLAYPSVRAAGLAARLVPRGLRPARLNKLAQLSTGVGDDAVLFSSAEIDPALLGRPRASVHVPYRREIATRAAELSRDGLRRILYYDQHTYLQSLLDRNDRMTMAASIECREPYLDDRFAMWAASFGRRALMKKGRGKQPLRAAMRGLLPVEVVDRAKWGFGVPWAYYMRLPVFADLAHSLRSANVVTSSPDPTALTDHIDRFISGDPAAQPVGERLIMMALWHRVCIEGERHAFA